MPALYFAGLVLGLLSKPTVAWWSEGTLSMESEFASYVGKFCFDFLPNDDPGKPAVGKFNVQLTGQVRKGIPTNDTSGELYLVAYSDERDHWKRVRPFWGELTCKEHRDLASFEVPVTTALEGKGAKFEDTVTSRLASSLWSGLRLDQQLSRLEVPIATPLVGTRRKFEDTVAVRQEIRPRFWYFAFINCGATIVEPVDFSIHAWNLFQGFENEFSLDQTGALGLESVFAVLFFLAVCASVGMVQNRRNRLEAGEVAARSSPLLRLLGASAGCSALGCACRVVNYVVFAYNGKGVLFAAVLGTFWACLGKAALTILQVLIAKGWGLLFTPDERPQRMAIATMLTAVITLSVGCEIWEQYFHDQSTSLYLHESWPGHIILSLNVFVLFMAWYFMFDTYAKEKEPAVRGFYTIVSMACGIYFAALPIICLLAELLAPWVQRKYVERVELSARFTSTVLLILCLRPSHVSSLVNARLKNRDAPELLEEHATEEA